MPEYVQKLAGLPITWIANINSPNTWEANQKRNITDTLKTLGENMVIMFNIMQDDDNSAWAIELINEYELNRCIKVGFVLPSLTGTNYYLIDDPYSIVAEKIVCLAQSAANENIRLEYECGIPTCFFSNEQLGILWKTGSALNSSCCSRMDITPDGELIYCLPLTTKLAKPFTEFSTYPEAKYFFEKMLQPYRRIGQTKYCYKCNLMRPDSCNGGCLAKIKQLKRKTLF